MKKHNLENVNKAQMELANRKKDFATFLLKTEMAKGNVLSAVAIQDAVVEKFKSGLDHNTVSAIRRAAGIKVIPRGRAARKVTVGGTTVVVRDSAKKHAAASTRGQKAAITRRRREAAKKANRTRKLRATLAAKKADPHTVVAKAALSLVNGHKPVSATLRNAILDHFKVPGAERATTVVQVTLQRPVSQTVTL